jgi:hypothetical protein
MANLIVFGPYDDQRTKCDECNREFILFWQRQFPGDAPRYCPFCGDDVEDIIDEVEDASC